MFIGKWNKSVIMTYLGLFFSVLGVYFCFNNNISLVFGCLICAGICDMLDGTIARMCKRDESEKMFGIELDSLADVVDFLIFPSIIAFKIGLNQWFHFIVYFIYIMCGIARLAYFNISLEDENKNVPIKYYSGLPVTTAAIIFPFIYFMSLLFKINLLNNFYLIGMLITSILFILNFKLKKPSKKTYPIICIIALIAILLMLGIL